MSKRSPTPSELFVIRSDSGVLDMTFRVVNILGYQTIATPTSTRESRDLEPADTRMMIKKKTQIVSSFLVMQAAKESRLENQSSHPVY